MYLGTHLYIKPYHLKVIRMDGLNIGMRLITSLAIKPSIFTNTKLSESSELVKIRNQTHIGWRKQLAQN